VSGSGLRTSIRVRVTDEYQGQGYGRVSGSGLTVNGTWFRETRVLELVKEEEEEKGQEREVLVVK
jgi:hypothetical protein